VGCAVALLATAASGTAYAAENLPPLQPQVKDLKTQNKACATGDDMPYVATSRPVLTAVLADPTEDDQPGEGNRVQGEFEAWWTDASGVEQRLTHTTYLLTSGSTQRWQLPQDVPANTVVSWRVRANDGTAVSPWSSDGSGSLCQFVYDDTNPAQPAITSPDYPEDQLHDGVGVYGSFTIDSPSTDVVAYRYHFIGGPYATVSPDEMGGPATVRFLPTKAGPNTLAVQSIDRSGRASTETTYGFRVQSAHAPVAHWQLDDPAGSTSAAADTGTAAQAGKGVTFGGPAPVGTSLGATATLDGSGHAFLTPGTSVVDTRKTFAVSAWVRPAEADRTMTVASQDTDSGAGFTLGLYADDSGSAWSFTIGGTRLSGGAPEAGEWAHLVGLYDAETGKATLYVNGHAVGSPADATPASATGAFQIGRVRSASGYQSHWHGGIGDVRAYDRVVVPDEVAQLAHRTPRPLDRWSLENATDGASPEADGGTPLQLGGGATIYHAGGSCDPAADPTCLPAPPALVGDGHLTLDGVNGYAATDAPVVDTAHSFTVGVVVRLADDAPAHPMTVLSQGGEHTDAFKVRYEPSAHAWQLVMPSSDEAGAPETVVSQVEAADGGQGQGHRLAVVYDDATDTVTLYADGNASDQATAHFANGWHSSGPLQVGRAHTADGGWREYLHGDVDEVQAFAGAVSADKVSMLGTGAAVHF
jgi:concanavalin A-like lectin/glucanase superfamily protein